MKRWKTRELTRACLFSALLALLMGCNNDGSDPKSNSESTFSENKPSPADDTKVPNEPVVGEVKEVPDTTPKLPVTTGGEPNPIEGLLDTAASKWASRFIEVAPDTADAPTYDSSPPLDYNLGNLVTMNSPDSVGFTDGKVLVTPVKGLLRYPEKARNASTTTERFPIVIFLHGQHGQSPSYKGYDYLAKELAEHGYVVASIDANVINATGLANRSGQSRAQLVLGTLDRLRQLDGFGQIDLGGNKGKLDPLMGKLDFSRIGIMGHSRGGQAIATTILFNTNRHATTEANLRAALKNTPREFDSYPKLKAAAAMEGEAGKSAFEAARIEYNIFYAAGSGKDTGTTSPYDFKGAFMLAPTDFGGNAELNHVPLANLLPSCDGDVSNLQGARAYDHNRFGLDDDPAPRYQIMVNGANHNFYNTDWTADDFGGAGPSYCYPNDKTRKDSIRLTPDDQRRGGLFTINSFMRYHVGGEKNFAAYWNGLAELPKAACPSGVGPCDERVVLTLQKGGKSRMLVQRFERHLEQPDSLKFNELNRPITFSGFDDVVRCAMPMDVADDWGSLPKLRCDPKPLPEFGYGSHSGLASIADHVKLAWSKPPTLNVNAPNREVSIVEDITGISAKGFDSLTFRIAVVRPIGQEVEVTLTDTAGKSATVDASNFSDALYNAPKRKKGGTTPKEEDLPMLDDPTDAPYANGEVKILLNMVAIPLQAFEGVDLAHLKELKLSFPKESGKVAITDIELQNFGRDERLTEIALSQAGMLGGAGGGVAFGSNEGVNKSAGDEDNQLIVNH